MKRSMRVLCASLIVALSPVALAEASGSDIDAVATTLDSTAASRGQTLVAAKIATTPTTTTVTYDPPTGKMGWGNVKIALALAQASLANAGITKPTAAQLQAALNGGDVTVKNADGTTTTTTLKGVLQMRAAGMGWGQIAQANGTKLGPVLSGLRTTHAKIAALPMTKSTSTTSVPTSKSLASKGITTAASTAASPTQGKGAAGSSHGTALGSGIVTAAGGGANPGASVAASQPHGAGVITATGGAATSITTAQGDSGNHGKSSGKGKGGG
jgi:hypothetical protein